MEDVIRRGGIGGECIAAVGVTCTSRESGTKLEVRTASALGIEERKASKPRAQILRIRAPAVRKVSIRNLAPVSTKAKGMTVTEVPESERARMREKVRPVTEKYTRELGDALGEKTYEITAFLVDVMGYVPANRHLVRTIRTVSSRR